MKRLIEPGRFTFSLTRRARRLSCVFAWSVLTVYLFTPAKEAMDVGLDPSNYASYAAFTAEGVQYGADVVPMAGPYGFVLYGTTYGGELFWVRTLCELLVKGALAALILWFFFKHRDSWWRWGWLGAHLALTAWISDLALDYTLLLAGLFLLCQPPRRSATIVLAAALMGFLSLFKGTQLMFALATLAVVLSAHARRRDWSHVGLVAGSYVAGFMGFWLLAGQNPLNIPGYVGGIIQLASGYTAAMSLMEPPEVFQRGIIVVSALAVAFTATAWRNRRDLVGLPAHALFAGFLFVQWKHGFVRAGSHSILFFYAAAVLAIAWYLFVSSEMKFRPRMIALAGMLTILGTALHVWDGSARKIMAAQLAEVPGRMRGHSVWLAHLPQMKAELDRELQATREFRALPLTVDTVGTGGIDLFGFEHGVIPLNRLSYQPRPMGGGSFNVYNRYLMELNRRFLRDPARRPPFYLMKFQTIDDRFAAQDDGLALRELLHQYAPVHAEHGYLLLESKANTVEYEEPVPLGRQIFRFTHHVAVPDVGPGRMLLARFYLRPTLKGRLRSLVYKPPLVWADLQGYGIQSPDRRRIIPPMANVPFILSPVVEDNADFLTLYTDDPGKRLLSFQLVTEDPDCFERDLAVDFYSVPRPPPPETFDAGSVIPFARTTVETIDYTAPGEEARRVLGYMLHAPGVLHWPLQGTEREFSFDFGLIAGAYEEGQTDGVEFIVELATPDGSTSVLARRHLHPAVRTEDRGKQSQRVVLPSHRPGAKLMVRTDPGPQGDTAWDWSYIARPQFVHGSYSLDLFPGFDRAPSVVDAEIFSITETDGGPAVLLHAPGSLIIPLSGDEQRLSLGFGMLPGAYTNDGATDGADFVIHIQSADGTQTEIFRRALRPRTVSTDRGRQLAEVTFSASTGDQLVIRTDPGPASNNHFDWTYIGRFAVE